MEVISIYLMMMQKVKIFCSTYLNNIYATNILYRAVRKVFGDGFQNFCNIIRSRSIQKGTKL